jgi:heat-inducible transcriptional repressor
MNSEGRLPLRAHEILTTLVREYIDTGEPVASRSISKVREDGLSPASIRNAMADLADLGFLSQPHTSAGRIPTEKAFEYYVATVGAGRIPAGEAERIESELQGTGSLTERVERSSHILTELTHNVGIAAAFPSSTQILDQVELVLLADGRVLMVVVMRGGELRQRVVVLEEPVSQEELQSIRNYVNRNFSGWSVREARLELLRRMDLERATYDATLRKLSILYGKGLLDTGGVPEVYLDGASNLIGNHPTMKFERIRDLLRALEEKKRLLELLDRFLEEKPGEIHVKVGLGETHPALNQMVLIGIAVPLPSGVTAKIAVLGPMRIRYPRVMGTVLHLGRAFERVHQ